MNYYEETLNKIVKLLKEKKHLEARLLIESELNQAYVPKDFEIKLNEYLKECKTNNKDNSLSDEEIEEYLFLDDNHQLLAVSELLNKNLRNYLPLVNKYLTSEGFINAKVILIDSLIRQEINEDIKMTSEGIEYDFIPKYLLPVEESDGYLEGKRILEDEFMKNPSMYKLGMDLLYKETILKLPLNLIEEEGRLIAHEIIRYIYQAFGDEESLKEFDKCH